MSRRPEHLAKLAEARKRRTPEQLEAARAGLVAWNASPAGKAQTAAMLAKNHAEWSKSEANLAHLARLHDSWARTPEGRAQAARNHGYHAFLPALRERDGDTCALCGEAINFRLKWPSPMSRSVDHVVPRRAGGSDEMHNLQLAHLVCNQRKGARLG